MIIWLQSILSIFLGNLSYFYHKYAGTLCRFYFLLADIQSHHLLQIKHGDTLNMAADINATIEKRLKELFKLTISCHLFELE